MPGRPTLVKQTKFTRRSFIKGMAASALVLNMGVAGRAQTPLRISLPPLQDSVPMAFANTENMFADAGLAVEFIGISSRSERSSALLSNNLDGVVSDISTLLFNRGNAEADVVITSTAFEVVDESRQLALLASGFFGVEDIDGLLRRINNQPQNSILVSRRTDFELMTDELLESVGIQVNPDIQYADTDDLVNAATFLVGGSVLSAVLPEPLAILAEDNELIDEAFLSKSVSNFETVPQLPSIVVFRREVLESRADDIATFYEVYNQAINAINDSSNDSVRESAINESIALFLPDLTRSELPSNFGDSYIIPTFPSPGILNQEDFDRVQAWAKRKDYLFGDVDFDAAVDFRFVS
jgi:NitT/TauT family transport system substrate-binding protein